MELAFRCFLNIISKSYIWKLTGVIAQYDIDSFFLKILCFSHFAVKPLFKILSRISIESFFVLTMARKQLDYSYLIMITSCGISNELRAESSWDWLVLKVAYL